MHVERSNLRLERTLIVRDLYSQPPGTC